MKTSWFKLVSILFALLFVAAACGSDDDAGDTSGDATTTEAPGSDDGGGDAAAGFEPGSPECVAPSDPGGGWDFTCRTIGQLFEDLDFTSNVVITNQPGGGGGVAFADIAGNRSDDSDLVIAASPATAIRFGQNQYVPGSRSASRTIGFSPVSASHNRYR